MKKFNEKLILANDYGRRAFYDGKRCIPAADKNFLALLEGLNSLDGSSAKIAKAWLAGWTYENLRAPV